MKKWIVTIIITCLVAIMIGNVIAGYIRGIKKFQDYVSDNERKKVKIQHLNLEIARYTDMIKKIETDPYFREKISRDQLQMSLPGEKIYRFTNEVGEKPRDKEDKKDKKDKKDKER